MLKGKLKKFIAASLIILTSLSIFSSTSFAYDANPKANRYFGGKLVGGLDRPAWYSPSVASYGYTSHFDSARAYWNNNTKINIWKWDKVNNGTDRYYVGTTKDGAGNLAIDGQMSPYIIDSNGKAVETTNYDRDWNFAVVTIYHNAMSSKDYQRGQANATAAHEVGHSLKFAHTPKKLNFWNEWVDYIDSTMVSDPKYSMKAITTPYDLETVHQKWGY